jgi:hypothetical protein
MSNKILAVDVSLVVAGLLVLCLLTGSWFFDMGTTPVPGMVPHQHWSYTVQPTTVQAWMTFDYLNRVFALPPNYFQETLGITNPRYPEISIRQYAQDQNIPLPMFLTQVQQALSERTATSTP